MRIVPFEVAGPFDRPDVVGAAIAGSLARELESVADLVVRDASSPPGNGEVTLGGTFRRTDVESCLEIEARAVPGEPALWSVVRCSAPASLSDLVGDAARDCVSALGRKPPALYPYVGRVEGGAEMAASSLLAEARDRFRRFDFTGFGAATQRLLDRFPTERDAHVLRAWARTLEWDAAPTEDRLSALRNDLDQLERLDPTSPYPDVMQAYVYRASGAPDAALRLFSRVLERDDLAPSARSWALRQRSYVYVQIGQGNAARADAEEAVRLDPASALALVAWSRALEAIGEFDASLARAADALSLEPGHWRHLQRAGIIAIRAGAYDRAVDYLRRACDSSGLQEGCANLAVALYRSGRAAEARQVASRAETMTPSPWGTYNLACMRALDGDREAALVALDRASELGFADVLITTDPDLNGIRGDGRFEEIVERVLRRIRTRRQSVESVFPWQTSVPTTPGPSGLRT